MPYTTPGSVSVQTVPAKPRNHIRSSSHTFTFTDERGPGAHKPLGSLPRRRSLASSATPSSFPNVILTTASPTTSSPVTSSSPKRANMFRIGNDDDDDDNESDDGPSSVNLAALKLRLGNSLRLNTESLHSPVPFPRSSPSPSPTRNPLYAPEPSRPLVSRTNSSPIVLSNGKPLKSSLKSSSSSPVICNQSVIPSITRHVRARSAPVTPRPASPHGDDDDDDAASTASYSPLPTPKSVHFAENETLASVCFFNSSARPRAISTEGVDDTETETEPESTRASSSPFPRVPAPRFELDTSVSSAVPARNPSMYANVHLEAVSLANGPGGAPVLAGTLLARNVSFEKILALRFTLDDWQTTSEVHATHAVSLPSLPSALRDAMHPAPTMGDVAAQAQSWDRFTFSIRLADYAQRLDSRKLWLVARFTATGVGEWWDNNDGKNYFFGFRPASPVPATTSLPSPKRVFSSPPKLSIPPAPKPVVHSPPSPSSTISSPIASATAKRLARFSFSNYSAPRPAVETPPSPPLTPQHESQPSLPASILEAKQSAPDVVKQPMPAQNSLGLGFGSLGGTHCGPVTLHWPWGLSGAGSCVPSAIEHLEKREKDKARGEDDVSMPTPPDSVSSLTSSPVLPFAKVLGRAHAGWGGSPALSPRGSPSDSGDESSGRNSPDGGKVEKDPLYHAFVKHWCFAQGPANAGSGVDVG